MEVLGLLAVGIALTVFIGSIMGFVAVARIRELREALARLVRGMNGLREELKRLKKELAEKGLAAAAEEKPEAPVEEVEPEVAAKELEAELKRLEKERAVEKPPAAPPKKEPDVVPALIRDLRYGDMPARRNAAVALRRIGPEAEKAVPALTEALRDADSTVRSLAADALERIVPEVEEVEPEVPAALPADWEKAISRGEARAPAPAEKKALEPAPAEKPEAPAPVEAAPRPEPVAPRVERGPLIDQERWKKIEQTVGKNWMTWAGVLAVFAGVVSLIIWGREAEVVKLWHVVVLGVILGIGLAAAGERFIRREMRALGQGLVGGGLAVLYVSLFAAYGYCDFPREATFALMALVTAVGMTLAVAHDAIPISFLAVLGGLVTPLLLRTGEDPRNPLFAYLLLLDAGVLGVAFFKRWRALDLLAFLGTWGYFTAWYFMFYTEAAIVPATLWMLAFFALFLVLPFVFHLRGRTPVTGERFAMAVANAAVAFAFAFYMLKADHKYPLGLLTLCMSASYIVLGSLTRKRIREDARAVFGLLALSVMLLTVAVPILLDLREVTVTWAIEAVLILYLAYKYDYFPARVGSMVPLVLAAGRIFTPKVWWGDWPIHEKGSDLFFNPGFGSAILVAAAGGAYALVHHFNRESSRPTDGLFKGLASMGSSFLALTVISVEVWQWCELPPGGDELKYRATAFVWAAGTFAFLISGMKIRSLLVRLSGAIAFLVAAVLVIWDYELGMQGGDAPRVGGALFFNGRFLVGLAGILAVFAYGSVYRRSKEICRPEERESSAFLYGAGIFLLALLASFETWQQLTSDGHDYAARCVLPFVWAACTAAYLGTGIRMRSVGLRVAGIVAVTAAGVMTSVGYAASVKHDYLMFFNWRFVGALAVAFMVFVYAHVLRRRQDICEPDEQKVSTAFYGIGILLLTVLVSVEMWLWMARPPRELRYLAVYLLPMIWAAGTAGYLVTGMRLRSIRVRLAGIGVLIVAGILAAVGYGAPERYPIFFNLRFAGALAVAFMVFTYAHVLRRRRDICEPDEQKASTALYGIGILLLTVLVSVEMWRCMDTTRPNSRYVALCLLPLIWVAGAASYLATGIRLRSAGLRRVGLAVLCVAGVLVGAGYANRVYDRTILFNGRFLSALAVPVMVFIHAYVLRRLRGICSPDEERVSVALYGIGIFLVMALASVETWRWCDADVAWCLWPVIWAAGAAAYLGAGIRLRAAGTRSFGLLVLTVSVILAARGYGSGMDPGHNLYLNGRFLAALAVVVMFFAYALVLGRFRELCQPGEERRAWAVYGIGFFLFLVLLSVETHFHFRSTVADAEEAKFKAHMYLSIVWGVCAAGMLAIGFWRNWRVLRLSALGLFGLTALKLVIIDMAKLKGPYRVASFLVLGALMIGASYLYHRVEKWLEATAGGSGEAEE